MTIQKNDWLVRKDNQNIRGQVIELVSCGFTEDDFEFVIKMQGLEPLKILDIESIKRDYYNLGHWKQ